MIRVRHLKQNLKSYILLGLGSLCYGQVGTWSALPTLTEVRDLIPHNSDILLATDGGMITFSSSGESFTPGIAGHQIRNLDVQSLALDDDGLLWMGSRSPGPIVEVLDLQSGEELDVEFVDLDEVSSFVQVGDSVYATYRNDLEGGVLLYRKNGNEIEYLDLFSNFPTAPSLDLSSANDVTYVDGKIVFRTAKHLLWAEQNGVNLKDPSKWNLVALPGTVSLSSQLIPYGQSSVLISADKNIYVYDFNSFSLIHTAGTALTDLGIHTTDPATLIYATSTGLFELNVNLSQVNQLLTSAGIEKFTLQGEDVWMTNTTDFLGRLDDQGYNIFSANRPRDHFFNRMMVDEYGDLVAGALNGISINTHQGWHTIHAGNYNTAFTESEYDWNRMITDTLNFVGNAVVEDMLTDLSGKVFLTLQGRGILKLDVQAPLASIFYNVEEDVLEPTYNSDTYILTSQMAVDQDNNLWATTKFIREGGHVVTIISESGEAYHIDQDVNGLDTRMAKSIAIDDNGLIWLGSQVQSDFQAAGGIHLIEKSGSFQGQVEYRFSSLIGSPLASNEILQLEVDAHNTLWILTPAGVQSMVLPDAWKSTADLKNWANLYMTTKSSETYYYWQLTDYNVTGIEIDARGNHWFLSSNEGVHVLLENGRWINGGFGYNTSNSELIDNEIYSVAFDANTGNTYLSTPKGISILHTPFANPKADYSSVHIYPQPFNPGIHERVIIQGIMDNSSVKILTVSGQLVKELSATGGEVQGFEAQWDGRDEAGDKVGSGVYLLYLFNEDGAASSQKLAVLR